MLDQRHFTCIELMLAYPTMSISKLAEKVGVNRNTISDWRRNNTEFIEEYKRRLREKWEGHEVIAMQTMQKLAENGDFKASKYILDSLGYNATQKIEADINSEINIVVE